MKTFVSCFLVAVLLPGTMYFAVSSSAQAASNKTTSAAPSSYKLISVKVIGSKRFTQREIATASGLPVGTVAHEEDFQKAARQLGESGAFSNIDYTYKYQGEGTELQFKVVDADKFVPVHFTDFVWFNEEDLIRKLHERIPLFDGELPTSGKLPGQVSDVLQAVLDENEVPGQVQFAPTQDKNGKVESINYYVVGVSIRVYRVHFPGASAAELPLLEAAAEKMIGREYSRPYMNNFAQNSILAVYREHGYLRASCAPAEPKVVKPAPSEKNGNGQPPTLVDITFPVTPGVRYKVSGWEWSGNKVIATSELQPLINAKVGQFANAEQLHEDLRIVQRLYGSRGYIAASVKANAEFNDAAQTVLYHLVVDEGSLFRMGDLQFRGLDNSLTAKLRNAWKLRPGDVYDMTYLQEYLALAQKLLPASLDWDVDPHVTAMARDKTVDVDLQYTAKAPR